MSEKFSVEIISPDKSIIKTNAIEVIIPSYEGEMGILKDHIPLITFLRPGFVRIKSEIHKEFFVEDGTVEFAENNLCGASLLFETRARPQGTDGNQEYFLMWQKNIKGSDPD